MERPFLNEGIAERCARFNARCCVAAVAVLGLFVVLASVLASLSR